MHFQSAPKSQPSDKNMVLFFFKTAWMVLTLDDVHYTKDFIGIFAFGHFVKTTFSGDSIQFQARTIHTAFQSTAWEPDGSWTQSKPLCSVCKGPGWAATLPVNERLTLLPYEMGVVFSDATGSEDSSTFLFCDISRFSHLFGYFWNSLCLSIDYLHYGLGNSCTDVCRSAGVQVKLHPDFKYCA